MTSTARGRVANQPSPNFRAANGGKLLALRWQNALAVDFSPKIQQLSWIMLDLPPSEHLIFSNVRTST